LKRSTESSGGHWLRLAIVQPYVPSYRQEFFERLIEALRADRVDCFIVAGRPLGSQGARGDAIEAPWIRHAEPRTIHVGKRRVNLGGSMRAWKGADAVVVGLVGSSIDTYVAVISGITGKMKVGLWGHVKSYTAKPNGVDLALERWQMRHVDHVFAYSVGGASAALAAGTSPQRVTALMNSVDTTALSAAVAGLTDAQVSAFLTRFNLRPGRILACLGGLDASKRVDLAPDLKVLVAGKGSQAGLLDQAIRRGQVVSLGYAGDVDKALIGRTASAFINPGRIGLLAVEGLLLRVPIITTDWPYHAPEEEYLSEGVSKFVAPNEPKSFAAYINEFCSGDPNLNPREWSYPTLEAMVQNFRSGVLQMLDRKP
jgi:hypothetical protein